MAESIEYEYDELIDRIKLEITNLNNRITIQLGHIKDFNEGILKCNGRIESLQEIKARMEKVLADYDKEF